MGRPEFPSFPRVAPRPDGASYVMLGLLLIAIGAFALSATLAMLSVREALAGASLACGLILLGGAAYRHRKPWTRHRALPLALAGVFLLALSAAWWLGIERWWPLFLVAFGFCSAAYGLVRRKRGALREARLTRARGARASRASI